MNHIRSFRVTIYINNRVNFSTIICVLIIIIEIMLIIIIIICLRQIETITIISRILTTNMDKIVQVVHETVVLQGILEVKIVEIRQFLLNKP